MRVVCTQENLKNGLQTVSRVISSSNTLPILNNLLLKTENGSLKISSTNLEIAINTSVRCKIEEDGSVCVPAKIITELISTLPNTNITVETTENGVTIRNDGYTTRINSLSSDEFPLIPVVENGIRFALTGTELKSAIDQVLFAASTSQTQPEISGILFKYSPQEVLLVATDRYRLAEKRLVVDGVTTSGEVVIPQRTAAEISRIASYQSGSLQLILQENQIACIAEGVEMVGRLIDGQYPDYNQIIPKEFITTVTVPLSELLNALRTSAIFSQSAQSITLAYKPDEQKLVVKAASGDLGESTIDIAAKITGDSGSLVLNYRYVLDALNSMEKKDLIIKIVNDSAPVVMHLAGSEGYTYLVMPIKT